MRLIPSTFTGPIDIGTGQETSVLDLADALGRSSLPIKDVLNEPDSLCADITKLRSLGWSPTINILERIREKCNYLTGSIIPRRKRNVISNHKHYDRQEPELDS